MHCPCHSGLEFEHCCQPLLDGEKSAGQAEQLMRSRYTAFSLGRVDYLQNTWHTDFVPSNLAPDPDVKWIGLEIIAHNQTADHAEVEFEASFISRGLVDALHEHSRFVLLQQRWLYTDGDMLPSRFKTWRPARNEPCPCHSGKKFKRCCGSATTG